MLKKANTITVIINNNQLKFKLLLFHIIDESTKKSREGNKLKNKLTFPFLSPSLLSFFFFFFYQRGKGSTTIKGRNSDALRTVVHRFISAPTIFYFRKRGGGGEGDLIESPGWDARREDGINVSTCWRTMNR